MGMLHHIITNKNSTTYPVGCARKTNVNNQMTDLLTKWENASEPEKRKGNGFEH